MVWVLPGVAEILANCFRPVSRLISEDLPTLERPITANSGRPSFGKAAIEVALQLNSASVTLMIRQLK